MSLLNGITGLPGLAVTTIAGFPNLTGYFSQLHKASWRGVSFVVEENVTQVGRRNVEHLYPYRDIPWMEDIGRKARIFEVEGFLVGDDVIAQRDKMVAACERPGPGTLVHPTFGTLTVSLAESVRFRESKSHGRKISINFTFEESGQKLFPSQGISTGALVTSTATAANNSIAAAFKANVLVPLSKGAAVLKQVISTATFWTLLAVDVGKDATSLFHLASESVGPFGRFYNGATGSSSGSINGAYIPLSAVSISVANLINVSIQDIDNISTSAEEAIGVATNSPLDLPTAFQELGNTLMTSIADPADAIRIFQELHNFSPPPISSTSYVGQAQALVQNAIADLCRRIAAILLAQASSVYQPVSQNDAANIESIVTGILDQEILIAGDQGDDDTFISLSNLRTAVAQNLIEVGSQLPPLKTFTTNQPMPSLALAYQYYGDLTRTDQLVDFANPVHPAFMPTSFEALSF